MIVFVELFSLEDDSLKVFPISLQKSFLRKSEQRKMSFFFFSHFLMIKRGVLFEMKYLLGGNAKNLATNSNVH